MDELTARGHRAVAMDLPCEDSTAGVERYAATVVDARASLHGGRGGRSSRQPGVLVAGVDHGDGTSRYQPEYVERFFTHDAPDHTEWVAARLRRRSWAVLDDVYPLRVWPAVASAYIVCRDDRVVMPDWQRRAARELLGVEPIELDGGPEPDDRAVELAAVLDQIAVQPPSTTSV